MSFFKNIPVLVGFGVSKPAHVTSIAKYADGVIVGSYLMGLLTKNINRQGVALKKIGEAVSLLQPPI